MIIADEILDLLQRKRRLKLTTAAIAEILSWEDKTYQQRVKASCLMLYEQGRLIRDGRAVLPILTSTVLLQLNVNVHNRQEATILLAQVSEDWTWSRRSASGTVDDSEGGTQAPRFVVQKRRWDE